MDTKTIMQLIDEAKEVASRNFCCVYSNYTVGAALLTNEGKVYKGFNIENDGIQSICAERTAFAKALSEGQNKFICIAIVGKKIDVKEFSQTLPCGYCRQFMSEYCTPNFMVYTYDDKEKKLYSYSLKELLPHSFKLDSED